MDIEITSFIFFLYCILYVKNGYETMVLIKTIFLSGISNYLLLNDDDFFNIYDYDEDEVNSLYLYSTRVISSYILFEIYYSIIQFKKDYILHSLLLFLSIILVKYYHISHYMTIAMVMQTSTIFLMFIKKSILYKILFASTFFIYRIVLFPLYSYLYYVNRYNEIMSLTINVHQFVIILVFSINSLNLYWFCKIVKLIMKPKTQK